jgi:predicted nucleic acid-binding protein
MANRYVLDTNIFAAILRNEPVTTQRVARALAAGDEFLLCPVVFYEVYRGLLYRDAKKQLTFFLNYITTLTRSDFVSTDWERAARLWADLRQKGQQVADADLLIGVYAIERQAVVITDNEKDFISLGVAIENWRQ